jgi:hypothetical protein
MQLVFLSKGRMQLVCKVVRIVPSRRVAAERGGGAWTATGHQILDLVPELGVFGLLMLQLRMVSLSLLSLESQLLGQQVRILPRLLHLHLFQHFLSLFELQPKLMDIFFKEPVPLLLGVQLSLDQIVSLFELLKFRLLLLVGPD